MLKSTEGAHGGWRAASNHIPIRLCPSQPSLPGPDPGQAIRSRAQTNANSAFGGGKQLDDAPVAHGVPPALDAVMYAQAVRREKPPDRSRRRKIVSSDELSSCHMRASKDSDRHPTTTSRKQRSSLTHLYNHLARIPHHKLKTLHNRGVCRARVAGAQPRRTASPPHPRPPGAPARKSAAWPRPSERTPSADCTTHRALVNMCRLERPLSQSGYEPGALTSSSAAMRWSHWTEPCSMKTEPLVTLQCNT
jgi:hypothetical protein